MAIIEALMGKSFYFTSQRLLYVLIIKQFLTLKMRRCKWYPHSLLTNLTQLNHKYGKHSTLHNTQFPSIKRRTVYQYEGKVNTPILARRPRCLAFAQQEHAIITPLLQNTISYTSNYQPRINYTSLWRKGNPKNHAPHSTAKTYYPTLHLRFSVS